METTDSMSLLYGSSSTWHGMMNMPELHEVCNAIDNSVDLDVLGYRGRMRRQRFID